MYSEHDEEIYILEAVAGQPAGWFLDVGAYDGVNFSNTRALYERGWSGVFVEPGLDAFRKLLEKYPDDDPRSILVNAAIRKDAGRVARLGKFRNNMLTFSTTEVENYDRFKKFHPFTREYFIPQVGWTDLLSIPPAFVDVLSIDTEGTSVDVLKLFPFASWGYQAEGKPRVICVEHDDRIEECDLALGWGYERIYKNQVNVIYRLG